MDVGGSVCGRGSSRSVCASVDVGVVWTTPITGRRSQKWNDSKNRVFRRYIHEDAGRLPGR
eukprot:7358050-Prorocentrum_lima.AAC.1